jgi:hypothetical protein
MALMQATERRSDTNPADGSIRWPSDVCCGARPEAKMEIATYILTKSTELKNLPNLICNHEVRGSNPLRSTIPSPHMAIAGFIRRAGNSYWKLRLDLGLRIRWRDHVLGGSVRSKDAAVLGLVYQSGHSGPTPSTGGQVIPLRDFATLRESPLNTSPPWSAR